VKLGNNASGVTLVQFSSRLIERSSEKSGVFECHKWFKEGRENLEDYEESDHNFLQY
jgi:hypothetical protein